MVSAKQIFRRLDTGWRGARISRVALGKYIVLYASVLHIGWAGLLIFDESATGSTPIHILSVICGGAWRTAFVLIITAIAAIAFPFLRNQVSNTLLAVMLIPQQLLLVMSAGAGVRAAVVGHYADGVARSWPFIMGDQLPVILLAVLYTGAVLEAAFEPAP